MPELLDPGPAPLIARRFLDANQVAELTARGGGGGLERLTPLHTVLHRHLQVSLKFFVELFVLPASPEWQLHPSPLRGVRRIVDRRAPRAMEVGILHPRM